uniref:NADH-ubiquinone oxidoreductase chain 2 n=1 Tax=Drilus flavescens TaxID=295522 RepID=I7E778_9COLE|nr:NADH dehydrogenase subunit 2 [Drilus flavescens]
MAKMYKILFLTTIFMSTLISVSSYSWFGMWLGLEINLLSIIPMMQVKKSILSSESTIKYFLVQAMASTIIMISVIFMVIKTELTSKIQIQSSFLLMMNSALLTKMGTAPFHFWFPEVLEGLDWMNCLLILTWQKIAPMVLFMYNMNFNSFVVIVILASVTISGILGINQISVRKILAYSSISHMGWMMSTMISETIWFVYFAVYSLITLNLVIFFNKCKIFFLNQLYISMNNSIPMKLWFITNFLSMGGIPPFLGFMPKWLTIQILVENSIIALPVVMIIFTLISIFMYTRIAVSAMLLNTLNKNWVKINYSIKSFVLAAVNFISVSSLVMITMAFNLY